MAENGKTSHQPAQILQELIRFDTTNPPGNEGECVSYISRMLNSVGIETTVLAKDPARPNLIARLQGNGTAPPLLLYGHTDVVTTANQEWSQPPFEGKLVDGYIWGRGALDMKSGLAMMLAAILRLKENGISPAGDIVFAAVCDEEATGEYGSEWLVTEHAEQFAGIRYAISEFGGFPLYYGGHRFYSIQVAEKQFCRLEATLHGPGGHASVPIRGGIMARLGKMLKDLDENRLPVHITPAAQKMIEAIAAEVPMKTGSVLLGLLDPSKTDAILDEPEDQELLFDSLLHNTVNATIVQGGQKINVIPSQITVQLDGRLLPGLTPPDMLAEVRNIIGDDIKLECTRYDIGPTEPDMGLFDNLAEVLRQADPEGLPLPTLVGATTDARYFSRLGIQTYGFTPMNLSPEFNFSETIHGADERIPAEAVAFGADIIYQVLKEYR